MRLLFDQNVSPKLVDRLVDVYPGCEHVQSAGLGLASDEQVWQYARQNGLAIVTKDEDFREFSVVRGSPPKVIWLRMGNCTTARVEAVLRAHVGDIEAFDRDASVATLLLS